MKKEQNLKRVIPFNTTRIERESLSRTIKAQYYKNGFKNFIDKGEYGATGVLEYGWE